MKTYGIDYQNTLDLPIKTFWFMNSCVDRLVAEQAKTDLDVGFVAGASDEESYKKARQAYESQQSITLKIEETLDADGLNGLRGMQFDRVKNNS